MITNHDIKDAAFRLFARKGYAETSMDDIARKLNLKKQSLYSHFESKAEIFSEILRDQSIIMIGEIGGVIEKLSDQPADILLKGIFESYIRIFTDRDRLLLWKRIILMNGNEEYDDLVNGMFSQFSQGLSKYLYTTVQKKYRGLNQYDFNQFFISYMLTIFGYLEWMLIDQKAYYLFSVVWSNFWDGATTLLKADAEYHDPMN